MRYILLAVSGRNIYPVSTDLKLIAFFIALFCRFLFRDVYIIDTDTGACFWSHCRGENTGQVPLAEPAKSR